MTANFNFQVTRGSRGKSWAADCRNAKTEDFKCWAPREIPPKCQSCEKPMHAMDWANGSLCWQLYVPQTVYSHNMTSWRAREARMYHWLCLILLKLSELTKHNRSNHIYQQHCYNMIYTIVPSITYKLSPSPRIRMWKNISHTKCISELFHIHVCVNDI